jgi:hypothetical protein
MIVMKVGPWLALAGMLAGCSGAPAGTSPTPAKSTSPTAVSSNAPTASGSYRLDLRLSGSYKATITSASVESIERDGSGMLCAGASGPVTVTIDAKLDSEYVSIQIIARDTNVGTRLAQVVVIPPQSRFPTASPGASGATNFGWTDRIPLQILSDGSGRLDSDLTQGSYKASSYPEHIAGGWNCV